MLALNQFDYLTLAQVDEFAEKSIGYFLVKDPSFRFVTGNEKSREFTQLSIEAVIGLRDYDLNWLPGGHNADYFNSIDKEVMRQQRAMTNEKEIVLKANSEGEVITTVTVVSKRPVLHNGKCLGVALEAFNITDSIFPTLSQQCTQVRPVNPLKNLFSPRELDCIRLLLFGYSYKHIANKLNLSSRTVEGYIEKIKIKLNCHNKQRLIDKLLEMGFTRSL